MYVYVRACGREGEGGIGQGGMGGEDRILGRRARVEECRNV